MPTKERKLTPKQKRFAEAYTDPTNKKTFGNGTQSALETYNTEKPIIAGQIAQQTLSRPYVQNYIEDLNAKYGNSIEERTKRLGNLTNGNFPTRVISTQKGADGQVISRTEVVKDMTPREMLRAIDLSNKMEGLYNRANVAEHVAKREYDALTQRMRDDLRAKLVGKRNIAEDRRDKV